MNNPVVIPADIVAFFIEYGIFKKTDFSKDSDDAFSLHQHCRSDFYSGRSVSLLLHRLGLKYEIKSSLSFENIPNGHKRDSTFNVIFNWNNIQRDLSTFKVDLNSDLKLLIIAGESTAIIQLLQSLHSVICDLPPIDTNYVDSIPSVHPHHEYNERHETIKTLSTTDLRTASDRMTESRSITTNQSTKSSVRTLPQINGVHSKHHGLSAQHQQYTMHHKLPSNNRFLKMLSASFSSTFFVSVHDAQRILVSEPHLLLLFTEFKFPDDVSPDMKRYRVMYDSDLRSHHQLSPIKMSWFEVSVRSNLLSFLHQQKLSITKFLISSNSKNHCMDNTHHPVMNWMSNNSHNAVKSEMFYLIELVRFGLSPDFRESHLSIVFNAVSTLHAILRALHSLSHQILEEVADWFVNDAIFKLLVDTVLSLKAVLATNKREQINGKQGGNKITSKQSNQSRADCEKKMKILSHLGYEIWNILISISTNNTRITLLSIFDRHLQRLDHRTDQSHHRQNAKYFAIIQCLFQLLAVSLSFSKQFASKKRTYSKHLRIIVKKLQHEKVIDHLISQCSSHLLKPRHDAPSHPVHWSPSKIHLSPLRMHYEQRLRPQSGSVKDENQDSRPPSSYLGDENTNAEVDCDAVRALSFLWTTLSNEVTEEQKDKMLSTLQKVSRSSSISTQIECLEALFLILAVLAKLEDPQCTPKVYRLLIFHLVENHGDEMLRDMMLTNFISIMTSVDTLPINVFIEPLIRQTAYYGACQLHFDLFDVLLDHKRLGLKQAMLIIHLIGKVCISDRQYHTAALGVLLKALGKYHVRTVVQEYCSKFFRVLFSNFVQVAQQQHLDQIQQTPTLYEANFNKMEITIKTLMEIAKQIESMKHQISDILTSVMTDYVALFGHIHPLLKILHSSLKVDTNTMDTARITGGGAAEREGEGDREREDGVNVGCDQSIFRSDRISTTTSVLTQSHLQELMYREQEEIEEGSPIRNRPTTPEIENALRTANSKYIETVRSRSKLAVNAADDDVDSVTVSSPSTVHSIESSEMSEFEPSPVDTVTRAIADIKMVRAKYQKQKSLETTLDLNTARKKKKSPSKSRSNSPTKKAIKPILKKKGISKEMRQILERHRYIFRLLIHQYLGRKPTQIKAQSFDDMKRMKSMLSLAEFNLIFENYKVSDVLISKNQLKGILRETAQHFGGSMCSIDNFLDSLCYIAQTAKFTNHHNGNDRTPQYGDTQIPSQSENVGTGTGSGSAPQQLMELINYMKRQHQIHKLRPIKLWEMKPPTKRDALSHNVRKKKITTSSVHDAPENVMEEMETEILYGSPQNDAASKGLKGSKSRKRTKHKMAKKHNTKHKLPSFRVSEKFSKFQQGRLVAERQKAEIKEMRRQRRMNEIRENLQKMQQQKRAEKEEKERQREQQQKEDAEKRKMIRRQKEMERKVRRQQIEEWKAQKARKEEEAERIMAANEEAQRLRLSKKQSMELVERRKAEIEEIKQKRMRWKQQQELQRQKEEEQRNKYLVPRVKTKVNGKRSNDGDIKDEDGVSAKKSDSKKMDDDQEEESMTMSPPQTEEEREMKQETEDHEERKKKEKKEKEEEEEEAVIDGVDHEMESEQIEDQQMEIETEHQKENEIETEPQNEPDPEPEAEPKDGGAMNENESKKEQIIGPDDNEETWNITKGDEEQSAHDENEQQPIKEQVEEEETVNEPMNEVMEDGNESNNKEEETVNEEETTKKEDALIEKDDEQQIGDVDAEKENEKVVREFGDGDADEQETEPEPKDSNPAETNNEEMVKTPEIDNEEQEDDNVDIAEVAAN